jgi:hypothetical protein
VSNRSATMVPLLVTMVAVLATLHSLRRRSEG